MNLLIKIIAGGPQRKNRFRTEKNTPIFLIDIPYIVFAIVEWVKNKFNCASDLPIVNYSVLKVFKQIATLKPRVLEFGSGRSSIWWLKHGATLTSVEHNADWYQIVSNKTSNSFGDKFHYIYKDKVIDYASAGGNDKFDLIVNDGHWRKECMEFALENNLNNEGIIYLDDSDKSSSFFLKGLEENDSRGADSILQKWAYENDYFVFSLINFSPTHLFVKEGTFAVPKSERIRALLSKFIY